MSEPLGEVETSTTEGGGVGLWAQIDPGPERNEGARLVGKYYVKFRSFITGIKNYCSCAITVVVSKIKQYDHFCILICQLPSSRHEKINDFIFHDVNGSMCMVSFKVAFYSID